MTTIISKAIKFAASVATVTGLVAGAGVAVAPNASAANPTYHTTDDVGRRNAPTASPNGQYGIPKGAAFNVECQVEGEPVGPRGNKLYFRTNYNGTTYVPDYYTDSPHMAADPPIAGIPMCGSSSTPPPPPPASGAVGIWVGSPVNGTWGLAGDGSTTPAGGHHQLAKASPQNDFAGDLSATGPGQAAYLYVAPSDSAYNGRVTTVVSQIIDDSACRNGGGGDLVTVQIRLDGTTVGQATFAHLDRNASLTVGQAINRWGTFLGSTANLNSSTSGGSDCWTGPHLHYELRASTKYACWNRGYGVGQGISRSNFVGFVSGASLATSSRPCP